jgi:nicotinate-nucleotide pyrophosphorylase (carboxylating)
MSLTITPEEVMFQVENALQEDIGTGDMTAALLPEHKLVIASVIAREPAVFCGRNWLSAVYYSLDPSIEVEWCVSDGDKIIANQDLCFIKGNARAILSGERTALNFLQTLSGTATITDRYAQALIGTDCRLLDTRKTFPGLRRAQKYAVSCGGGHNHRLGLYDGVLIKENHIAACGSITLAVEKAKALFSDQVVIEVEVENIVE